MITAGIWCNYEMETANEIKSH